MARKSKEDTELDYFTMVRDGVSDFVEFSEIEDVAVVPTIITSYNRATGRGGHPLGRLSVIHGPNQVGKSGLALAILESLNRAKFPGYYGDGEFANEKRWYNSIVTTPGSVSKYVPDLDVLERDVTKILTNVRELQSKGKMPKTVGAAFVVDTLTKMLPAKIKEQVEKDGIEKMYPIQALYISTWMKLLIPELHRTNSAMIAILQERKNVDAKGMFDKKWKTTGGESLQYDNCLRVRVTHSEKVKRGDQIVGMQCFFVVENNKIDGTTYSDGSFFTSNGQGECPIGLDLVSEMLEEAKYREWLKKESGQYILELHKETTDGEDLIDERVELGRDNPSNWRMVYEDPALQTRIVNALNATAIRMVTERRDGEDGTE